MNIRLIFSFFIMLLFWGNSYSQNNSKNVRLVFKKEFDIKPWIYWQQTPSGEFIKTEHEPFQTEVPNSDTLTIEFGLGFKNDLVTIKCGNEIFRSDTLNTIMKDSVRDTFFLKKHDTLSETEISRFNVFMRIPKNLLKEEIVFYLNAIKIETFRVNLKYSCVHLEYNEKNNVVIWRYYKYALSFL
ncbi:MAG: hypothetical protein QM737_18470 [Ferruginibacter sp.]